MGAYRGHWPVLSQAYNLSFDLHGPQNALRKWPDMIFHLLPQLLIYFQVAFAGIQEAIRVGCGPSET